MYWLLTETINVHTNFATHVRGKHQRMGLFPQMRQIMMHAQLAFATHMGLIAVTFTFADHHLMIICHALQVATHCFI